VEVLLGEGACPAVDVKEEMQWDWLDAGGRRVFFFVGGELAL